MAGTAATATSATEEAGSVPLAAVGAAPPTKEPARAFLRSASRDLSDEELATPAARRFLIADIERLDQVCAEQEEYVRKYHDQRVEIATLTQAGKTSRWNEILSFICLSVGAAGLGAAPSYLSITGGTIVGLMIMGGSLILVGAGVASKVWK